MSVDLASGRLALRDRQDTALPRRLARSIAARGSGIGGDTAAVPRWLTARRLAGDYLVERIEFDDLDAWAPAPGTGNLTHSTGRFFTVEGLRVVRDEGTGGSWEQPIIHQPEVGVLGIVAAEFDGVLHFLLQAKMEPGNPRLVQLSPTVQATRSNYMRAHRGSAVRYLDYFTEMAHRDALVDVQQAEHGSWFYRKVNRNVVVEVADGRTVPVHEGFRWLTLGQIGELLEFDNVVNMDTRTVLACLPHPEDSGTALHSDAEVLSWFTGERTRRQLSATLVPLEGLSGWRRGNETIEHEAGRHFRVIAARIRAGGREVAQWTQPLLEPRSEGVVAFALRRVQGVPHVLVSARVEAGFLDTVELGPTLQYLPADYAHRDATELPAYRELASAPRHRILHDTRHSEEGGRFLDAVNRCLVVEVEDAWAAVPRPGYRWLSLGQLGALARHGHYVNVQARTLMAVLNSGPVTAVAVPSAPSLRPVGDQPGRSA